MLEQTTALTRHRTCFVSRTRNSTNIFAICWQTPITDRNVKKCGAFCWEQEPKTASGFIDLYGHHTLAGGWFFCGWITLGWGVGHPPGRSVVTFDEGDVDGEAFAVLHPRHNLHDGAEGIAFFVRGAAKPLGRLRSVTFETLDVRAVLKTADAAPRLRELELVTQLRPVIARALPGLHRDILLGLLGRVPYHDEDTLAALGSDVFIEIDEAILSGFDSLVLMGWCLAPSAKIHEIRLRCGQLSSSLDLEQCLRLERPDVIESLVHSGFDNSRCGSLRSCHTRLFRTVRSI